MEGFLYSQGLYKNEKHNYPKINQSIVKEGCRAPMITLSTLRVILTPARVIIPLPSRQLTMRCKQPCHLRCRVSIRKPLKLHLTPSIQLERHCRLLGSGCLQSGLPDQQDQCLVP